MSPDHSLPAALAAHFDRLLDHGARAAAHPADRCYETGCIRCGATELADASDLCPACRAFMLGDTDIDPKASTAPRFEMFPGRDPVAMLAAGDLYVLQEDGSTVTGPDALDVVRRHAVAS